MGKPRTRTRDVLLLVVVVAVAVPLIVVGAMALRSRSADGAAVESPAVAVSLAAASSPAAAQPQQCSSCWQDEGAPSPKVVGEATVEDGVQVLNVGLVSGYYAPNTFTVEAGAPVRVVFTGRAEGCLAEPEFAKLGLKGDMSSGSATLDLGSLKPGTYTFTCSMGVNEGTVTAR